jgi:Chalcone isomerase-like
VCDVDGADLKKAWEEGFVSNAKAQLPALVEGDDFARAFLAIWLGAKPPNPSLKAGLLGGACG